MKLFNLMLSSSVVLALAGCGNQDSKDESKTTSGADSKPNYNRGSMTNNHESRALSPGSTDTGSTNYPGSGTNDQAGATNSFKQPLDAQGTNNLREN